MTMMSNFNPIEPSLKPPKGQSWMRRRLT